MRRNVGLELLRKFLAICCICAVGFVMANADVSGTVLEAAGPSEATIERALKERGAEYYAYMDLNGAKDSLKPIILKARELVIFSKGGWAADGMEVYVTDGATGTIKERVPCFSELFPADWEPPT